MNGLDIVILGVFFVSALIGAMRGFTKELLSLFCWGGAVTLSYMLLPCGRGFMEPYIANPMIADGVALFCMFIVALIVLSIIASLIAGYIHESSFRGLDHSLGFGFGMLRGVVLISAAELIFSTFSPRHSQSPKIQTARFIPMARNGGDTLLYLLPARLRATIIEQAIKVEHQLNSKVQEHLKQTLPGGNLNGALEGSSREGGHAPEGLQEGSVSRSVMEGQGNSRYLGSQSSNYPSGVPSQPQSGPTQPGMLVIHPPQPGQAPPLAPPPLSPPLLPPDRANSGQAGEAMPPSVPRGLGQTAAPQDKQTTVDELSRLKPQSSVKEESGYTRGQRDDMNRLFQFQVEEGGER